MMDERTEGHTEGHTDGRTWATLNALPHSTNGGGIKIYKLQGADNGLHPHALGKKINIEG